MQGRSTRRDRGSWFGECSEPVAVGRRMCAFVSGSIAVNLFSQVVGSSLGQAGCGYTLVYGGIGRERIAPLSEDDISASHSS